MENELFKAIVITAGFIFIIKHLGVWLTGLLGLGIMLFGCGSNSSSEATSPVVAQASLTLELTNAERSQCVNGQTARINQGYANCLMLGIRTEEYCQTCKENEWANVEATFVDIEADAKVQYEECIVSPELSTGWFPEDYCVSVYHSVIQQRMSECQHSLYCFTI